MYFVPAAAAAAHCVSCSLSSRSFFTRSLSLRTSFKPHSRLLRALCAWQELPFFSPYSFPLFSIFALMQKEGKNGGKEQRGEAQVGVLNVFF